MVVVQDLLGMLEVEVVLGGLAPRKVQHELDVVVLDAVVRGAGIVLLELGHLLVEDSTHFRGPLLGVRALAELLEVAGLVHSELLLDGAELVVEIVLALLLVDLALDLLVDLLLDLEELQLHVQHRQELHRTHLQVVVLQQVGLVGEIVHLDGSRDEIDQELEIVYGTERGHGLLGHEGRGADNVSGLLLQRIGYQAVIDGVLVVHELVEIVDARHDIRLVGEDSVHGNTLEGLEDGSESAVGHLERLDYLDNRAVRTEVLGLGVFDIDVELRHGADEETVLFGLLDELDGLFASYRHRIHGPREDHGIPEGQDGKLLRKVRLVDLHGAVALHYGYDIHSGTARKHEFTIEFVVGHISSFQA